MGEQGISNPFQTAPPSILLLEVQKNAATLAPVMRTTEAESGSYDPFVLSALAHLYVLNEIG